MADVFVSYKAEDRRRVQPLVQALQADGYSVWWDEHIGTGDEWRQTIERELDAARCVIVIGSSLYAPKPSRSKLCAISRRFLWMIGLTMWLG